MFSVDSIKAFIEESSNLLIMQKGQLEDILKALVNLLEEFVKTTSIRGIVVQGRVKSIDSLHEKIIRKNCYTKYALPESGGAKMLIDSLPNLIGIRLVCLLSSEEELVYQKLREFFSNDVEGDGYCFASEGNNIDGLTHFSLKLNNQPERQKNGNDIYRLSGKWFDSTQSKQVNIELQIKSLTHLFWGELEHMLFYKNYAYIVAGDYYHEIIMHIETELKNIDNNLLRLTQQVVKNDYKQTNEIKQIAGMFLHTKITVQTNQILGFDIDLRTICDLIVDMYFRQPASAYTLFDVLSDFISKVNEIDSAEPFDISLKKETFDKREISENGRYFANIVDNLINSGDLFWAIFYKIYCSVHKVEVYSTALKTICENFSDMVKSFESCLPIFEEEDVDDLVKNTTYSAIAEAFKNVQKMDFFVYKSFLNRILSRVKFFFECNSNSDVFAEITRKKFECISPFMSEYIRCMIMASCNMDICREKIIKIMEQTENTGLISIPIDIEKYSELISSREELKPHEFFQIFPIDERV